MLPFLYLYVVVVAFVYKFVFGMKVDDDGIVLDYGTKIDDDFVDRIVKSLTEHGVVLLGR